MEPIEPSDKTTKLLRTARNAELDDPIQVAAFDRVKSSLFRSARGMEGHSVSAEELVDWGYTRALRSALSRIFESRKAFIAYAVMCMKNDAADRARSRTRRAKIERDEAAEGVDGPLLGELYAELEVYLADLRSQSKELNQAVDTFWECFWGGVRVIQQAVSEGHCEIEIECPSRIDETNFIEVAIQTGLSRTVAYERFNLLKSRLCEHPVIGKTILS